MRKSARTISANQRGVKIGFSGLGGIVAAATQWMTAGDPANPLPTATARPVFPNRFDEIRTTARRKSACPPNKRAYGRLVKANRQDESPDRSRPDPPKPHEPDPVRLTRRSTRLASRGNDADIAPKDGSAPRRGRTTISSPLGNVARCRRNASRIRRFQRLRTTALPTRREIESPKRHVPVPFSLPNTTSMPSAA